MRKPYTESQSCSRPVGRSSAAFLLAQVGAHAASKFAERLAKVKLAPSHAGMFWILSSSPGMTQQRLAAILAMVPSRLIALVDDMEARGLIERRENRDDRRRHALHVTDKERSMLDAIGQLSLEHSRSA